MSALEQAMRTYIAGRTQAGCTRAACVALAGGLLQDGAARFCSSDVAACWLRAPLPLRRYGGAPPRSEDAVLEQLRSARAAERSAEHRSAASASSADGGRQATQVIDVVAEIEAARAGVRETQQRSETRTLTIRVDTETETVENGAAALRQAVSQMQRLLVQAFNRGARDEQQFFATVSRSWLTLLREPVRLRIELVLSAPDSLARRCDLERPVDVERVARYVSANVVHFTVNLFGGVPELAVPLAALNDDAQRACLYLSAAASLLFDPAQCRFTSTHELLDGFLHNDAIGAALDRSRLLAAACRSVVDAAAGTPVEEHWRETMITTLCTTLPSVELSAQAGALRAAIAQLEAE